MHNTLYLHHRLLSFKMHGVGFVIVIVMRSKAARPHTLQLRQYAFLPYPIYLASFPILSFKQVILKGLCID